MVLSKEGLGILNRLGINLLCGLLMDWSYYLINTVNFFIWSWCLYWIFFSNGCFRGSSYVSLRYSVNILREILNEVWCLN